MTIFRKTMKPRCYRGFLVLICFVVLNKTAYPQSVISALQQDPSKTVQVEFDGKKINLREDQLVRMEVTPKPSPVPALKHRLFPSLSSLKKGDSATLYHRAILFHRQYRAAMDVRENRLRKDRGERVPYSEQTFDELSDLIDQDLTDQEMAELKKVVEAGGEIMFNQIKLAGGLRDCDWGFDVNEGRPLLQYISFLLPEIQEIRSLTRFLSLRAKVQIASNDFEGAIETIRMGLKMAKTTEETRFIVCTLVGVACSSMMLNQVESMIGAKNSPNLYWALEALPKPLLSMKTSVIHEVEFLRGGAGLKVFQDPENQSYTTKKWNEMLVNDLDQLTRLVGGPVMGQGKFDDLRKFQSLAIMLRGYPVAKRQIVEWGFDKSRVEKMPAVQVLAIHESRMLKIIADEILKCLNLDPKIARDRISEVVDKIPFQVSVNDGKSATYEELIPLASTLLPAVNAVLRAENRVTRRIKFLQTIEALRLHANIHKTLPHSLDEVKTVPVPVNPDTGQSFIYRKTGDGCVLWEMDPALSEKTPIFLSTRVIQLKLRK